MCVTVHPFNTRFQSSSRDTICELAIDADDANEELTDDSANTMVLSSMRLLADGAQRLTLPGMWEEF